MKSQRLSITTNSDDTTVCSESTIASLSLFQATTTKSKSPLNFRVEFRQQQNEQPKGQQWTEKMRIEANMLIKLMMHEQEKDITRLEEAIQYKKKVITARLEGCSDSATVIGMRKLLTMESEIEQASAVYAQLHCLSIQIWTSSDPVDYRARIGAILECSTPFTDFHKSMEIMYQAKTRLHSIFD